MKINQPYKRQRYILLHRRATALLITCIVILFACSLIAAYYVEKIMENHCFQVLEETVKQEASKIRVSLESEEQQMQIISDILAEYPVLNSEICKKHLNLLPTGNIISSYSVLMPDNQMIYSDACDTVYNIPYDIKSDSAKPPHLSDRFENTEGNEYIAYVYPIKQNGVAKGVLYGYINLKPSGFIFRLRISRIPMMTSATMFATTTS